jgi:hypothetical protein
LFRVTVFQLLAVGVYAAGVMSVNVVVPENTLLLPADRTTLSPDLSMYSYTISIPRR